MVQYMYIRLRNNKEVNSCNDCDDWMNAHAVPTHGEDNTLCVTDSAFVLQ